MKPETVKIVVKDHPADFVVINKKDKKSSDKVYQEPKKKADKA
jgi:putative protein kinase ArgK-like GTPase of G3E family